MTNLELLTYALIGVAQSADILQQYEVPSEKRSIALNTLKEDRKRIENQIESLTSDRDKIVNILR